MAKQGYRPEEIIAKPREADVLPASGEQDPRGREDDRDP